MAVPIAFTSDHVETLYEIDIEYAEEAKEAGIAVRRWVAPAKTAARVFLLTHVFFSLCLQHFKRCPSLNDEPLLFEAQADIVKRHLDSNELHSPTYPLNCARCTNPMCRSILNPIKPYHKLL